MNPKVMDDGILRRSSRSFQSFVSLLTENVSRPTAKFIRSFLCGVLFSGDLVLTHVAGHVPQAGRLTATAKRFRRHLNCDRVFILDVLGGYWRHLKRRLDEQSLFIVDLTDLAKPRAKKMEYLATVRDGDQDRLVPGYWCLEVYALDREGLLWPVILWPFSVEAEGERSQTQQVLDVLSVVEEYFGSRFGLFVCDRGFDARGYIEPFCEDHRYFVIRQRGDRTVVLPNGVPLIVEHLVERLFAEHTTWLVYQKVFLPHVSTPLVLVAYRKKGYDRPVILLTNHCVENNELALRIRNVYAQRWECETAIEFLKSKIGLERFAVRRYRSIQRLIVLAALAMGFLSFLQSRCRQLHRFLSDRLRYGRNPKRQWSFRLIDLLREAVFRRCRNTLAAWCRPP